MSKVIKKIAPIALPIVGNLIAPGIGGALGGALGGAVSGGGLKSALWEQLAEGWLVMLRH